MKPGKQKASTVRVPDRAPSSEANPFSSLIPDQTIAVVDSFTLESGVVLAEVEVAYNTWGQLNKAGDNVLVICHALTGSSDVGDWWGPLMGTGLAFDPARYMIFCANVLGSPYGSASPVTLNPETNQRWGPEFPPTTTRDDVRLHHLILDHLGVKSVAAVIGGSMGGMAVLEWPLCTPKSYVRNIVPIATSARHSAWGISWGEAQRQSIYSDPKYEDGFYAIDQPPITGLAAARMAALLTYRSRDSFESRFGRKHNLTPRRESSSDLGVPRTPAERALAAHNDGHRGARIRERSSSSESITTREQPLPVSAPAPGSPGSNGDAPVVFSAQGYLRYQGDKFVQRFDANCYVHITRKMDMHDVQRDRPSDPPPLSTIPPKALVIAISSDGLFTLREAQEISEQIPDARLVVIDSPEGHDGFLLEFAQINHHILLHLTSQLPEFYDNTLQSPELVAAQGDERFVAKKSSVFGEAEVDLTSW
ncbi:hypothetical protein E5Q_04018 [Mixia osmundae IAM 14324]|uniref:AB hydrolase-1 domain-containing protein n=1 Tax=Mixia osmundae (strain CBS 9802 / IAM 14324 / JCM 22182 / KY 12970) TaxID=764103 RepID=G7E3D0_MIXOS|nr:hypothetical protein E5Q_04018 [Mixia osmundae IAM 14324]